MREIPLTKGKIALVDDADYEWLSQWKWFYHSQGYAVKNYNNSCVLMHRKIMNPDKGFVIDHINGNKLDNRRENMRICTYSDNNKNSKTRGKPLIKYKGVRYSPDRKLKPWSAEIHAPSGRIYLGSFKNENNAAQAYNFAALEHFGEFASFNQVIS